MDRLEQPIYFYLLAILPIIWLAYLLVLWWQKQVQKKFADKQLLKELVPQKSLFKSLLKMIVLSLGFVFIIIGLVNPKIGTALKTVKRSGVDLVFAIDVSKSMLAKDVSPSRLDKAKLIVEKIIDKLGSDRVGIIIYAGNAFPLLPITTDHSAAKMFLANAHPNMVSSQGTAIGEAVKLAQTYFDDDEQTNRFLFVISDGEDHNENTTDLTAETNNNAIKVYTIGVGTKKGGPIPIKINGNIRYKKDQDGNMVITQLHDEVLKEIAQKGNGQYVDGNKAKEAIAFAEELITNADKKEFETKEFSDYKDQFQWFIGLGLLMILLDVFLLEKKTKWIEKLNLFNEKSK
jgi:Ca-activated chloride channel family protein